MDIVLYKSYRNPKNGRVAVVDFISSDGKLLSASYDDGEDAGIFTTEEFERCFPEPIQ